MLSEKTFDATIRPDVDAKTHEWEAVRQTTGERKIFRSYADACEWIEEAEAGCFGFETLSITETRSVIRLA